MMHPLKWFLINRIKCSKVAQKPGGFTLLELLVGIVLAVLVITPLLGFMVNIMDTDRREQAKTSSEQEIKAALDYIQRDLQQAVYIYDADGIGAIKAQLPPNPSDKNYFPVLVFWKRQLIAKSYEPPGGATNCTDDPRKCDDSFVYSLVAYYLIKDAGGSVWSNTARIGRFQISDGYGATDAELTANRDKGFNPLSNVLSTTGDLKTKMNQWTSSGGFTQQIWPLVDYIDQTTITDNSAVTPPKCLTGTQQIPDFYGDVASAAADSTLKTGSFYVCVNSQSTVADVYIRGNALARIDKTQPKYNGQLSNYFPQANIKVKGRGFLFTQ